MKHVRDLAGLELTWVQPAALKLDFELRDGDEVVATLRFRSTFGSFATVETADGTWTFKRMGFFVTRVTICPAGSDDAIATFRNNTWSAGGTLELSGGRELHANSNFWGSRYEFKFGEEEFQVRFTRIRGALHLSSTLEISADAATLPELPWLVALGWYLVVMMSSDAAAGAAGGGAAAAAAAG